MIESFIFCESLNSLLIHFPYEFINTDQTVHRSTGAMIDEVIANTLKDEMIDGINDSPNVLVTSYGSGNHSAHNSDDGENNSKSPNNLSTNIGHDYEGTTLQNFTHLTNAADINRDSVYSTALLTPNSVSTTSIIHPIQTYENVLHSPGR